MIREELQNLSVNELVELVLNLQATNKQLQAGNDLLAATLNSRLEGNSTDHVPAEDIIVLVNNYHDMTNALRQQQDALEDQLRRTSLLMQISIELRETLEPQTIVERVLRVMFSTLHIVNASIVLVDLNGSTELAMSLRDGNVQGMPKELAESVLEQGLAGWVIRHGRSVVLPDVSRDKRWVPYMDWQQSGSVIVLPIRQAQLVLGALTVYDPMPNFFTGRDLLLMEGVVSQAGVALGAARRFREEAQRREQALTLLSMSQFLTAERSYDDLATMLQEKSSTIFGMHYGLLYLAQDESDLVLVIAPHTSINDPRFPSSHSHKTILKYATSAANRAWKEKTIINEVSLPDESALTCIALPLVQAGSAIGAFVLVRTTRTDFPFTANTWSLLTIFTNVIAATCANMQLITKLRNHTETLAALVDERTQQLQRSRDLLRVVFDHLPEGLLLLDNHEVVLAANNAFCQGIIGHHPRSVVGRDYHMLWNQLEQQASLQVGQSQSPDSAMRVHLTYANNAQYWYEVERTLIAQSSDPDANDNKHEQFLERWHDITRQEQLFYHLLLHEQLTTIGRLAASIVHEVGNPLQSTITSLELCTDDTALSESTKEYLTLAHQELERMRRILDNLRHLYRPPQIHWGQVDINTMLRQLQQLTAPQFERRNIELRFDLDAALPPIYGQPDALRQVFFNLVLNAHEAMSDGNCLSVTSEWQPEERMCQITIHDTGIGMNSEQITSAFYPFQSNKPEGVGLGLYLSKHIVEQHGGRILLYSARDEGTTAEVYLPQGKQQHGDSDYTSG